MPLSGMLGALEVELPACPRTLLELLAMLEDENGSVQNMARLIESDMALASAVVRTVNTAMFGLLRRVETVGEAVLCLGMREVGAITYSIALHSAFPSTPPLQRLWEESSRCALLMGRSARAMNLDPLRAHTAGLFARAGQAVLLASARHAYADLMAQHDHDLPGLLQAERANFRITHAAYGSALCANWGLAPDVVKYVSHRVESPERWQTLAEPLRDLLALGRLAEMLVDGTELHAALVQVEADTGLPAAVLERAVAEPWALLSKAL
ncbi:MAG: hypothetical protein RJA44_148 [Pseudomonadota bacterium]